jgi:predicted enzyme related to lactoylglutathione lyase
MGTSIEAVFIKTTRLAELAAFYQTGFGLPEPKPGDVDQLGFQVGSVYLAIEQISELKNPLGAVVVWFRVENLDAVYHRLLSLGAQVNSPPLETGSEIIAELLDPDGNAFGLISNR